MALVQNHNPTLQRGLGLTSPKAQAQTRGLSSAPHTNPPPLPQRWGLGSGLRHQMHKPSGVAGSLPHPPKARVGREKIPPQVSGRIQGKVFLPHGPMEKVSLLHGQMEKVLVTLGRVEGVFLNPKERAKARTVRKGGVMARVGKWRRRSRAMFPGGFQPLAKITPPHRIFLPPNL